MIIKWLICGCMALLFGLFWIIDEKKLEKTEDEKKSHRLEIRIKWWRVCLGFLLAGLFFSEVIKILRP